MKENFLKIWKEVLLLGVILLLITVTVRVFCYHFGLTERYTVYYDSKSYSYQEEYSFEKINSLRTPVYPILIRIVGGFGTPSLDELYTKVARVQEIISLASVFVMYLVMRKITKSKGIQSIGTLIYGCLPSIFSYNLCILTESLSISLFVLFIYTLFSYLKSKKIYQQILLAVQTVILVLLRPSFIYLFIFFGIFWLLSFLWEKENRKKIGIGILTTVIAGICILGYGIANQVQNGIKGLSYVSSVNQIDILLAMGLYGSYENDPIDEDITKIIEENISSDVGTPWYVNTKDAILEKYGYNTIATYNKRCIKHNFKAYIIGTIQKALELGGKSVNTIMVGGNDEKLHKMLSVSQTIFPVTFGTFYLIIIVEIGIWIKNRFQKNKWVAEEQMRFYTTLILAGMLAVTILGAQAEYQRLIVPILSAGIIILACYLEKIGKKQEEEKF